MIHKIIVIIIIKSTICFWSTSREIFTLFFLSNFNRIWSKNHIPHSTSYQNSFLPNNYYIKKNSLELGGAPFLPIGINLTKALELHHLEDISPLLIHTSINIKQLQEPKSSQTKPFVHNTHTNN